MLGLLRREKEEFDRKTEYMEQEKRLLAPMRRKWRHKLYLSYFEFKTGYFLIKNRLAFLEKQHSKRWHYSETLRYLIYRYESMLRGKAGRPPKVTDMLEFHLKALPKEDMRP